MSRRAPIALIAALAVIASLALTAAPALAADSAEMGTVSEISYASAKVTGKVTTTEAFHSYAFEYSTDEENWTPGPGAFIFQPASVSVSPTIEGLKSGTKYFVRLTTSGGAASPTAAPYPSFTTLTTDPPKVLSVDTASEVEYTTAKVTGKILRPEKSDNVACHFEYITDAQFTGNPSGDKYADATSVPCEPEESVATIGEVPVSASLTGLDDATTYHQRLVVSNSGPTSDAKEGPTFTTLTVDPPSVKSIANATEVEYTTAKVKGVVERPANPDPAFDLNCNFEYVTDAQFAANPPGDKFAGATPVACEGENPITANTPPGPTPVEATLTGLVSTTYHLRLSASNLGGSDAKEAASTFTTLTVDPPSVISIDSPTGIDQDSAKVSGEIKRPDNPDPAFDVNCRFQYVTEAQFNSTGFANPGEATCEPEAEPAENPIHVAGPSKVNARLTGLIPSTKYHLRLFASNPGGSDAKVAAATFTTTQNLPASAVVGPITEVSYSKATLSGEIDSENVYAVGLFQVSTDEVNWTSVPNGFDPGFTTKLTPISPAVVTGLEGGTKYFVRLVVKNATGGEFPDIAVSQPPYPSFTTLPVQAPTILSANNATEIGHESAKVSGEIERPANPDPAFDANCRFDYVTDAKFDANGFKDAGQTPCGIDSLSIPEEKKAVEAKLTDLKAGTEYHVRLTATNAGPDASVEIDPFTTTTILATVKATAGASDGKAGYTLQGVVNPNNSVLSSCEFVYGPNSGLIPSDYAFAIPCSPLPGVVNKPVTVEGHVTGLTPNATYHSRLVVKNAAGTKITEDQIFIPTLDPAETCPNEQLRKENSSLALPECRAYEKVTPSGKEGFDTRFQAFDGGERVLYLSRAGNIARSGQSWLANNYYVASRSTAGWETIPNLNGSSGSLFDEPSNMTVGGPPSFYSTDLLSSLWTSAIRKSDPPGHTFHLRNPDGSFTAVGPANQPGAAGAGQIEAHSDDLSHNVFWRNVSYLVPTQWGPGIWEYVGTGVEQPRRVDVDNSGNPVDNYDNPLRDASCASDGNGISGDGRVIYFTVTACAGEPRGIWARVNGTTTFQVSASQCERQAPAEPCNAPADATFAGAARDGSRVFFNTTQQMVDGDTDQTYDLYACDIPAGTPAPVGAANACTSLVEVSGSGPNAEIAPPISTNTSVNPGVKSVSEDGSTMYFLAKGALADNKDALGNEAVAGDQNLYVWRTDAARPAGQTTFVARLKSDDLQTETQSTPNGRYLVFTTTSQLLETDTDNARDVYRYDADTRVLTRVSTNVFGVGGNGDFDASIAPESLGRDGAPGSLFHPAISGDGKKIVFTTTEPLNLAVDNNDETDAYLWTPDRVSLISTGSVGGGAVEAASVDGSGQDIYFATAGALTPADGDDLIDIYDARIEGGFSFAPPPICSGEECQPAATPSPQKKAPLSAQPGSGNPPQPKPCPKGKVRNKQGKCVKKPHKKHHGKKHHSKEHKRANSNSGGGK